MEPDAVQAHFDRGVLEARIPKPAQKKPRQVQIDVGTHIADEPTAIALEDRGPRAGFAAARASSLLRILAG